MFGDSRIWGELVLIFVFVCLLVGGDYILVHI